jgi:hypothetical protein
MSFFSDEALQSVWEKGLIVPNYNEDLYRKDACGAWIFKKDYGNDKSIYGWEVDHIFSVSKGGDDRIENLRPMQHQNNVSKGNDFPSYVGAVTSDGNRNIDSCIYFRITKEKQKELENIYKQ